MGAKGLGGGGEGDSRQPWSAGGEGGGEGGGDEGGGGEGDT